MAPSLDDADHELQAALAGPEGDVVYDVAAIAGRLLRASHSAEELARWAETAAHGILAREIPPDKLVYCDTFDARLSALIFSIPDTELIKLWPATPLPNLRTVMLGEADIDWAAMPDCTWPLLARVFVFKGPGLANGLLAWLARQELPMLRRFHMDTVGATHAGFAALSRATYWSRLEEVDVGHNDLGGPWPALPDARSIRIPNTLAVNDDLRALLSVPLPRLVQLDISGNQIDNAGFDALLDRPLPSLTAFAARGCRFADGHTWRGLARADWPSLRRLDLQDSLRDPRVLAAAAPVLHGVTELKLASCDLDDAAAAALAAIDMPQLERLDVTFNQLTPEGVAHLVTARWPRLKALEIAVNPIGDRGVAMLARAPWWASLEKLDLVRTELTDVGLDTLTRSIPRTLQELRVGPARLFSHDPYERLRRALPDGASL